MFSTDDTIVAIATAPGRGGIGVVRLSGPRAHTIASVLVDLRRPLEARYATLATIRLALPSDRSDPRPLDHAIVTLFPAPHSYTGDDVVEISSHGSPVVLHALVASAVDAGARAARPGEFTLRAFLNNRIDLAQAEAVADLIEAVTPLQAQVAFDQLQGTLTRTIRAIGDELFDLIARLEASIDFPDEGYHFIEPPMVAEAVTSVRTKLARLAGRGSRGRVIREGRVVALVGPPNAGKSSLFNALVGANRAIVRPEPGTTRDLVSETVDMGGLRLTLVDTAGMRETEDPVELEGVRRSQTAMDAAHVVVHVLDGSVRSECTLPPDGPCVINVGNKSDLPAFMAREGYLPVSTVSGAGLDSLKRRIIEAVGGVYYVDCPEITNIRHLGLVSEAVAALDSAVLSLNESAGTLPEEFLLVDLQTAYRCLGEVTGRSVSDAVLTHIFERFCIGK